MTHYDVTRHVTYLSTNQNRLKGQLGGVTYSLYTTHMYIYENSCFTHLSFHFVIFGLLEISVNFVIGTSSLRNTASSTGLFAIGNTL